MYCYKSQCMLCQSRDIILQVVEHVQTLHKWKWTKYSCAITHNRHDCVVHKGIVRSSALSAGVLLRSSSIILEHVLYIVIVYYFRISWSKQMYKHVALAVLRYTECSKVNVHFRTRVYQTQIVHLSRNCQKHVHTQLRHATMSITQNGLHSWASTYRVLGNFRETKFSRISRMT